MPMFTKKPVTIEAVQYTGDNLRVILDFIGKHRKFNEWFDSWDEYERHVHSDGMKLKIFTLEGVMEAVPGDWIIKGVKGEFYPCKPDIFAATYDTRDDVKEAEKRAEYLRGLEDAAKVAENFGADQMCVKCDHPRSNHPFRHPFQPGPGDPLNVADAIRALAKEDRK